MSRLETFRRSLRRFSLIKGINIKLLPKMFRNKVSLISLKIISVLKIHSFLSALDGERDGKEGEVTSTAKPFPSQLEIEPEE